MIKIKKGRRPASSARRRTAALEFVKMNPGAIGKEILTALAWEYEIGSKCLQRMCDIGELRREPISVKQENSNRVVRSYQYWAVVVEIFSPEEVEQLLSMLAEGKENKRKEKEPLPPGVYKHDDPDRMAIPNQGGQGASGPRCFSAISQLD